MSNKCVFVTQPQSMVDVITNSSSELFIFYGKEKEVVEEMIKEVYPNYRDEYEELKVLKDLDNSELNDLLCWMTGSWCWPATKDNYRIPGLFTFDELYEPESNEKAWNGHIQYQLKRNYQGEHTWDYSFVTKENRDWVLSKLDPSNSMHLLYSKYENPNWDMQEELMVIGMRYHLG